MKNNLLNIIIIAFLVVLGSVLYFLIAKNYGLDVKYKAPVKE